MGCEARGTSHAGKVNAKGWKGKGLGVESVRQREAGRDETREAAGGSSWGAGGVTGSVV